MEDTSLIESDLKFIEECGGDATMERGEKIEVNETLFQDMNDLDLSESDDPDYDPNEDD